MTDSLPLEEPKRYSFTIMGKPFAKQRPRYSRVSGTAFTPKETVSFERHVGTIANTVFPAPLEGPVKVTIYAVFEPAKSWSKKKRAAHMGQYHTQKPDLDNIEKAVLDGLNRIAFKDDSQVACTFKRKVWGENARTVVIVEGA